MKGHWMRGAARKTAQQGPRGAIAESVARGDERTRLGEVPEPISPGHWVHNPATRRNQRGDTGKHKHRNRGKRHQRWRLTPRGGCHKPRETGRRGGENQATCLRTSDVGALGAHKLPHLHAHFSAISEIRIRPRLIMDLRRDWALCSRSDQAL